MVLRFVLVITNIFGATDWYIHVSDNGHWSSGLWMVVLVCCDVASGERAW